MQLNRSNPSFAEGVEEFINFAYSKKEPHEKIPCPCYACNNFCDQTQEVVSITCLNGIKRSYIKWVYHGETSEDESNDKGNIENNIDINELDDDCNVDEMLDMLNDFSNAYLRENLGREETTASPGAPFPLGRADTFFKLLKDSEEILYDGCESYSKLTFLVKLLHLKTISGWTNKSFDMLLELLKEAFQGVDVDLPKSYSESKRLMRDLGPKGPGNDIDVYLQPLIDELKELWEVGIEAYDAYKKENFILRAALMWTISDLPAYSYLSGWITSGYFACPICMSETTCEHLPNSQKRCYMGHRRFLPSDHKWRDEMKAFDGKKDDRCAPVLQSGEEILEQLSSIEQVQFEKNVCDNILGTLMNISGKTKDNKRARRDLMDQGLKPNLHLQGESEDMPLASYTLSHDQKKIFCDFLSSVKFPDGFASNISRCVKEKKLTISGLKSHDCHVLLQRLLPLATRGYLHKEVYEILLELSDFFRKLCSKTLYLDVLDKMEKQMALTLCKLERIFPPVFFDVMIHLMIHLASKAKLTGPVQYRWMFPFERYGELSDFDWKKSSSVVLKNCEEIEKFRSEHIAELIAESEISVEQRHDLHFPKWFRKRVEQLHSEGLANDELISLANGPDTRVKHYTGCNVNGFRFHTKDLKDIIEVDYLQGAKRVLIFKCDWWNLNDRSGIQMDRNSNITSVNVSKTWYDDQPFVLAYQMGGPGRRVVGQSEISSSHGDSNVHSHEEIVNSTSTRIKRRGRTRNVVLSKRKNANEKLAIQIPEEINRIIGMNNQYAITESGCLTRRFAPLQVTKWAKIEEGKKLDLLRDFKGSFDSGDNLQMVIATNLFLRGIGISVLISLQGDFFRVCGGSRMIRVQVPKALKQKKKIARMPKEMLG
ncbi:UNVERIFIED_CONTAM: hypothetical protein Sradi_5127000 [Sesamum radiatum]|uniref:Transposase n=1 Tax=Sesamum radiatum TaxID=300843 RepID=A0AAW2M228_SESRA